MKNKLIITGNPVDGFRFIGPFETHSLAVEYAEHYRWDSDNHIDEGDWWVDTIEEPDPSWPHTELVTSDPIPVCPHGKRPSECCHILAS